MTESNHAPGRLNHSPPVAIIDIGSNSVRLVVYESASRSPTPLFNEKVLAGLGRNVATTGQLDPDGVTRALRALKRFQALSKQLGASGLHVIATAAAREAVNGPEFIAAAEAACGAPIRVLTGKEEARLSALGVVCGFRHPTGLAADLGGGSLELIHVKGTKVEHGATVPLGGLRLLDVTKGNSRKASKIVRDHLKDLRVAKEGEGQALYAIGGTFRALGNVHMAQRGYPLHVMHHYTLSAREALDFARMVRRVDPSTLTGIETVSSARRPLLAYGAVVLEQLLRISKPQEVVISALGVREGLLYDLLDKQERRRDPLLASCEDLARLRSRSPRNAHELCDWTDQLFGAEEFEETADERRLRHAACLLADIGWRAHPDYRGEQSLSIIAPAAFVGVSHSERAFLSLAVYYRNVGLIEEHLSPRIRELASLRQLDRARLLGALLRVGHLISAATPDVITRTRLKLSKEQLTLILPADLSDLAGERLENRLRALARLMSRKGEISVASA